MRVPTLKNEPVIIGWDEDKRAVWLGVDRRQPMGSNVAELADVNTSPADLAIRGRAVDIAHVTQVITTDFAWLQSLPTGTALRLTTKGTMIALIKDRAWALKDSKAWGQQEREVGRLPVLVFSERKGWRAVTLDTDKRLMDADELLDTVRSVRGWSTATECVVIW